MKNLEFYVKSFKEIMLPYTIHHLQLKIHGSHLCQITMMSVYSDRLKETI